MIDVTLEPSENCPNETVEENIAEVHAERIEPANGYAVEEFQENHNDPPHNAQEVIRRAPGRPKIVRTGERRRPRKEFHYHQAEISEAQSAHLSEIPMREAMSGLEADEWRLAMVKEIRSIIKNDTWELVDRVDDHRTIIGTRMVLRNKLNPDGSIQ